jgi:hypothetical protein
MRSCTRTAAAATDPMEVEIAVALRSWMWSRSVPRGMRHRRRERDGVADRSHGRPGRADDPVGNAPTGVAVGDGSV